MGTYAAPGNQRFRQHATREIPFSSADRAQIGAGQTRTLLVETNGYATLFAEVTCDTVLAISIYGGWSADGPWTQLEDTYNSTGDPADPDAIDVFAKRPWVKLEIENEQVGATTDFALHGRLSTAVGVA